MHPLGSTAWHGPPHIPGNTLALIRSVSAMVRKPSPQACVRRHTLLSDMLICPTRSRISFALGKSQHIIYSFGLST
jgi:hypothetical protein